MSNSWSTVSLLTDRRLDERLRELARSERGITAELLAHLAEVDARRLCGGMAEGTTFNYCVRVLRFTEDEACKRIRVARTARKYPAIYDLVARGELGQTAVSRLAPVLTRANHGELLEAARGKTIRELEHVLAERFPKPDAPTIIRRLPGGAAARVEKAGAQLSTGATGDGTGGPGRGPADDEGRGRGGHAQQEMLLDGPRVDGGASVRAVGAGNQVQAEPVSRGPTATGFKTDAPGDSFANGQRPTNLQLANPTVVDVAAVPPYTPVRRGDRGSVAPLSPERYRVQLTVSGATRDKLIRAQQLMRRAQPDGDLAVVVDRALSLLVDELEGRRFGKCKRRAKAIERAAGGTAEVAAEAAANAGVEVQGKARVEPAGKAGLQPTADAATEEGVEPAARQAATTRKRSQDVPRALRRAVDDRDGGRCTFVGPDGRRCEERGFLDFHHRVNYAWGGETTLANLTLLPTICIWPSATSGMQHCGRQRSAGRGEKRRPRGSREPPRENAPPRRELHPSRKGPCRSAACTDCRPKVDLTQSLSSGG